MNWYEEVPKINGDYRMDDDRGTLRVVVEGGVVTDYGWVQPRGTVIPSWMLEHYHARFYGPLPPVVNSLLKGRRMNGTVKVDLFLSSGIRVNGTMPEDVFVGLMSAMTVPASNRYGIFRIADADGVMVVSMGSVVAVGHEENKDGRAS